MLGVPDKSADFGVSHATKQVFRVFSTKRDPGHQLTSPNSAYDRPRLSSTRLPISFKLCPVTSGEILVLVRRLAGDIKATDEVL